MPPRSPNSQILQQRFFLVLLALVTIAFLAVLSPFYGAVFWATILAVIFAPLQRVVLRRMPTRRNLAALVTLLVIMFLVILPLSLILASLVRQATAVYGRIASGEIDFGSYLQQILTLVPAWAHAWLAEFGLLDVAGVQQRLSEAMAQVGQALAPRAINIGQNTLQFLVSVGVMLYLLYFLLRDGATLVEKVDDVLEQLGPLVEPTSDEEGREIRHPAELQLNEIERAVLEVIDSDSTSVDAIVSRTGLPIHQVLATISALEIRHLVGRLSGTTVARRFG